MRANLDLPICADATIVSQLRVEGVPHPGCIVDLTLTAIERSCLVIFSSGLFSGRTLKRCLKIVK